MWRSVRWGPRGPTCQPSVHRCYKEQSGSQRYVRRDTEPPLVSMSQGIPLNRQMLFTWHNRQHSHRTVTPHTRLSVLSGHWSPLENRKQTGSILSTHGTERSSIRFSLLFKHVIGGMFWCVDEIVIGSWFSSIYEHAFWGSAPQQLSSCSPVKVQQAHWRPAAFLIQSIWTQSSL